VGGCCNREVTGYEYNCDCPLELLKGSDRTGLDTLESVETPSRPCDQAGHSREATGSG
jgi:hypothetical protein